ncbi:MAG: ABC transporter permease [Spirochaetaceae bacterium]|nr:ABC transporter permease [Spirochaetaceae bacterium]
MKKIIEFIKYIWMSKFLIAQMTKREVGQQYRRSYLGVAWSLLEPLGFVAVLYLVFGIGLRGGRNLGVPFIVYLISGIAVINLFTKVFSQGPNVVRSNSYILHKVNFRISILPIVSVLSSVVDHLIFMIPVTLILVLNGIFPHLFWFQIIYYLFALFIFMIGLTWFTSSVGIFFPDLSHIISVLSRMIFYFTPVFWTIDAVPEKLQRILKFNPLYYIAMGYRESLFWDIPFWEHPKQTAYFWGWTIFMLIVGILFFRRLRPYFADVI